MDEFLKLASLFIYGFLTGFFWSPFVTLSKQIWYEAKLAAKEWKNPNA